MSSNLDIDLNDQDFVIASLTQFTNRLIRRLLANFDLALSGNKEILEAKVVKAINDGKMTLADVVSYINEVSLWRRQHIYVYDAPEEIPQKYSTPKRFQTHLRKHGLDSLLEEPLPLVLPSEMQLVSVSHDGQRIRATAVVRTTHRERLKQEDEVESASGSRDHMGQTVLIEKRAYLVRLSRTLVSLEWDLRTNSPSFAQLQISEMPAGNSYSEVAEQFFSLTEEIFPQDLFTPLDLSNAVINIHSEEENNGAPETRSHRFDYLASTGGQLSGRSSTPSASVCQDQAISHLISEVRDTGNGVFGNVYFLSDAGVIESDLHIYIYVTDSRIKIARHCNENEVRHVISRIRYFAA
jgi:hypothetical protein